jgi:hypothetical protein
MPAVTGAMLGQWNTQHYRAQLRTIEAIRLHAHQNGGRLPASLTEIKSVPVPLDPYTNKPFEYALKDDVAELRPNAEALKKSLRAQPTRVFRIRIAKESPK